MSQLSQRGNNHIQDLGISSHAPPDVNQFIRERKEALASAETSPEERAKYHAIRAPANLPQRPQTLETESLPIESRHIKVEFNGTLREFQKAGEGGVSWMLHEANSHILQRKNEAGTPIGDLTKVIPMEASISNVKSTLSFDTCADIPGMEGEDVYYANGKQATVHIPAGANGTDNTRIPCHKLDPQQMRLAELHLTTIDETMLKKEYVDIDADEYDDKPSCLVKIGGEITRVLTNPENLELLGLDIDEYKLVKNGTRYFIDKDLVDLAIKSILEKAKGIEVPFVNHFKWQISLLKEDGEPWSDVDADPTISSQSPVIYEHVLNSHQSVSFLLHYTYALPSLQEQA